MTEVLKRRCRITSKLVQYDARLNDEVIILAGSNLYLSPGVTVPSYILTLRVLFSLSQLFVTRGTALLLSLVDHLVN